MKRFVSVLVAAVLVALAAAAAASAAPRQAHHSRHTGLPLKKVAALIELQHPRGLNRFVQQVSDPTSPRYRHYATVEQLVDRFGAKPRAGKRVVRWLADHGVHAILSPTHTFVTAELPAARAARLLPPAPAAAAGSSAGGTVPRAIPDALRGAVSRIAVTPRATVDTQGVIGPALGPESQGGRRGKGRYGSVLFHTGTAGGCAAGSSGGRHPFEPLPRTST